MSENLSLLSGRHGLDKNLFEDLVDKARANGTPSPEDLSKLAEEYLMGPAITYGAASFYDFLKPGKPRQEGLRLQWQHLPAGGHTGPGP